MWRLVLPLLRQRPLLHLLSGRLLTLWLLLLLLLLLPAAPLMAATALLLLSRWALLLTLSALLLLFTPHRPATSALLLLPPLSPLLLELLAISTELGQHLCLLPLQVRDLLLQLLHLLLALARTVGRTGIRFHPRA